MIRPLPDIDPSEELEYSTQAGENALKLNLSGRIAAIDRRPRGLICDHFEEQTPEKKFHPLVKGLVHAATFSAGVGASYLVFQIYQRLIR